MKTNDIYNSNNCCICNTRVKNNSGTCCLPYYNVLIEFHFFKHNVKICKDCYQFFIHFHTPIMRTVNFIANSLINKKHTTI
jgi:hypothetical protein